MQKQKIKLDLFYFLVEENFLIQKILPALLEKVQLRNNVDKVIQNRTKGTNQLRSVYFRVEASA